MSGKKTCCVWGCLNTHIVDPNLSFFTLPTDMTRRKKWLQLLSRQDLMEKNFKSYVVCEIHFDKQFIVQHAKCKILSRQAIPSLHLPSISKELPYQPPQQQQLPQRAQHHKETQANISCSTNTTENYQDTFNKLCDRFLTKELSQLVRTQSHLKVHSTCKMFSLQYTLFCTSLYYTSPVAYRLLQRAITIPSPKILFKYYLPVTTEINDSLMAILRTKVNSMSNSEKVCSIVVDAMSLKANLFYDISKDKIIGFHEVDGVQTAIPAKHALVVMVRGIFEEWKLQIGFALLAENKNYEAVSNWIDKLIVNLFDIGLDVRAFISNRGSDLLNASKQRLVTAQKPYFFIGHRKIHYIFNPLHLIKLFRDNLMTHDFHFQGSVGKWEHIVQFFEKDKIKTHRLAPKLTNSHIKPTNFERTKVQLATQVLSNSVAAGLSIYIDFNAIEEPARQTVNLIKKINDLFGCLNSFTFNTNCEHKKVFAGSSFQVSFLDEMLDFFSSLKLVNLQTGQDETSKVKFIDGFQITINSIKNLYDDLGFEGYELLFTRKLNQDVMENFLTQIKTKNGLSTKPTSRQFVLAYKKNFFANFIKPTKRSKCFGGLREFLIQSEILEKFLDCPSQNQPTSISTHSNMSQNFIETRKSRQDLNSDPSDTNKVVCSDYNSLDIPETNSLIFISSFILEKCAVRDQCSALKCYIRSQETIHIFSADTQYTTLIIPPDFVQFVKKMEEIFREYFNVENCTTGKTAKTIFDNMSDLIYVPPCPCFPIIYLKKLYIRLRIFNVIKSNNKAFKTGRTRRKYYFVVPNL